MTTAPTDSILAADVGSVTTRAVMLDIVGGEFRFVGLGESRSTVEAPFASLSEGLRHAIENLSAATGRNFMDDHEQLIMPAKNDGTGVGAFAATASAGQPLRVALAGLMPNVSLASAERVATTSYVKVVEVIGLGDRRREDQQLDSLLNTKPEVVILAGGTERGSSSAVLRLAETVALAAALLPEGERPVVLFVGNTAIRDKVSALFNGVCDVVNANNVRPDLDAEDTGPAARQLARLYEQLRLAQISGYGELTQWHGGSLIPSANAFGSLIRFFSQTDSAKGALGIDLGSAATVVAAAAGDDLRLTVRSDIGVGHSAANVVHGVPIERMMRWLPEGFSEDEVRDYCYNKSFNPAAIPHERRELMIEHALARQCLQGAVNAARQNWPPRAKTIRPGLLPAFQTLVATGAVLSRAPKPGQAALMLLDGLQPTGWTTILLDQHGLASALGAAAAVNPIAAVQVIKTAVATLATTVSLVGDARPGQTVARVKMAPIGGGDTVEIKVAYGSLQMLRIPPDREAKVSIQPFNGFDAGFGSGVSQTVTIPASLAGLIVDARGRPLALPKAPPKRLAAVTRWLNDVGEYGVVVSG
ncbi:MAG: glutamate mutase L [Chloroflexi bacterium]|nr:glutamate mutase L [Chloroflexota bacterium]